MRRPQLFIINVLLCAAATPRPLPSLSLSIHPSSAPAPVPPLRGPAYNMNYNMREVGQSIYEIIPAITQRHSYIISWLVRAVCRLVGDVSRCEIDACVTEL